MRAGVVHEHRHATTSKGAATPRWWWSVVAMTALAVAVAACGSSSPTAAKKTNKKNTATTSTTTSTTTAAVAASTSTTTAKTTATTTAPKPKSTGGGTSPCGGSTPEGVLSASCDTQTPGLTVNGAGANSAQPFFARVFYYYNQANHGVNVNYSPAGSSVGITDIQQNTVNFGQTEVPVASPASGTGGTILQVPVDLGGVALSYNIPGVSKGLKLDGPTLAQIFLGKITTWNASAITALNPGVNLPGIPIVPVHRADSSGPGYDLDQYLIDTASGDGWTYTSPSLHWPVTTVGIGEQLNTGVASYIQQTAGAIGYVEYAYSLQGGFDNAALKNQAGSFVAPSQSSIAAAGSQATNLSAANFNVVNEPGGATYPLANFSWTMLYQKQTNTNLGIVLGRLFDWVTTTGQQQAAALGYAPLPSNVVSLAHQTLLQLQTSSGQAIF